MSHNLSEKVLEQITKEGIKPISKRLLVAKQGFVWLFLLLGIFISGHSIGVLIYFFLDFDFKLLSLYLRSNEKAILIYGISVWMVLFFVGMFVFAKVYRRTKKGYRTEARKLFSIAIVLALFIGWTSYRIDIAPTLDQQFSEHLPFYQSWESLKIKTWSQPALGLLFGKLQQREEGELLIIDATGGVWKVDISHALHRKQAKLIVNEYLKFIGKQTDVGVFVAEEIRPWPGKKARHGRCLNADDMEACIKGR